MSNPLPDVTARLSQLAAHQKLKILRTAIHRRLGPEPWTWEDIGPRMARLIPDNLSYERWTLDGKPLVDIWPPELSDERVGNAEMMQVRVRYRLRD